MISQLRIYTINRGKLDDFVEGEVTLMGGRTTGESSGLFLWTRLC